MDFDFQPFATLLTEIVDNRGKTCPTASEGIPLIATNCISNNLLYPAYEKVRFVDKKTYDTWFRGHPKPGDLLFVTKGTPGRVCMVPNPVDFCIAQDMVAIRADENKIYPKYLFAILRTDYVQKQIEQLHVGTLIPHFKKGDFDKLMLPIPDRQTQIFVGDLYFNFSAKIDLNRRMNETLEAMARAIFKSWFVDFDPVRAKAEGRDTGLPEEIADLFPDNFEETELGEVPEGWNVKALPEAIQVNPSRSLRKGEIAPYLDMGNMPTTSARALQYYEREFGSGMKFVNNDTLVARITPCLENGKTCFVDFLEERQVGWGSTEYIVLSPKEPLPPEFAYFLARTEVFRAFAISNMTGTSGRQRVPAESLNQFMVAIPSSKIAERFGEFASSIIAVMKANDAESRTLAELRDTLLAKLISGELRVKEAEKLVGC
ncbi:MAG: Type I restriction modification DNA specificity domain protein [Methanomethylovorans sp. PtaU1.Bin073]|nr:MAG: Type I restriction modification DNA specificity domain protein [Methanomethylovorans sp. PtaU1.Bin073]